MGMGLASSEVDMAGTYSNRTDLLQDFAELRKRIEVSGPHRSKPSPPKTSGGRKKQLGPSETADIITKYTAGTSMAQPKVEHHMAKRTVAKVLRENGVVIRPRGGPTKNTTRTDLLDSLAELRQQIGRGDGSHGSQ
ncbi:hypothetical protein [Nocardia sp. NPDC049149]|uniref:hypothetical protein n=1 Tax=Nocardia sp. NPDC049149 TaxID=3364315 RepID=UPI0037167A07